MKGKFSIEVLNLPDDQEGRKNVNCIVKCDMQASIMERFMLAKIFVKSFNFSKEDKEILALSLITGHWPQDGCVVSENTIDMETIKKAMERMK